jgi:hypothetical protein
LAGYREILKLIPRCTGISLEEALERKDDPADDEASFIFGRSADPGAPGTSRAAKGKTILAPRSAEKRKGIKICHSKKREKYSGKNIPAVVKRYLHKHWPLIDSMKSSRWATVLENLDGSALAASTWKKYGAALRLYIKFCDEMGLGNFLDLSEKTLLSFTVWSADRHSLSSDTTAAYISGLKTLAGMLGIPAEKTLPKSVVLCLKGNKNTAEKQKITKKCTAPLTFRILKKLRSKIGSKVWKGGSKKVVWAACCVGYFGAFRAGELLAKFEQSFDRFSDLLWEDVKFFGDGAQILIKSPKVGGPGGEKVDIFRFTDPDLCPVRALKILQKSQKRAEIWGEKLPVFRFGSGKNLTVSNLSRLLKKLLAKTKYRYRPISAKSIRSGLPTDMESHPDLMNDQHIKNWGRWRSKSYQLYMRNDRDQKRWVFEKICKALN